METYQFCWNFQGVVTIIYCLLRIIIVDASSTFFFSHSSHPHVLNQIFMLLCLKGFWVSPPGYTRSTSHSPFVARSYSLSASTITKPTNKTTANNGKKCQASKEEIGGMNTEVRSQIGVVKKSHLPMETLDWDPEGERKLIIWKENILRRGSSVW
jgi:hypothetical protein